MLFQGVEAKTDPIMLIHNISLQHRDILLNYYIFMLKVDETGRTQVTTDVPLTFKIE